MTPTETILCQVYSATLEVPVVTVGDDILSLGGDSFHAVRIALELEEKFGIHLPLELFESETSVGEIAAWIDARRTVGAADVVPTRPA